MPIAGRDSDYNYYDDLARLYPSPQAVPTTWQASAVASSSGLAATAAGPPIVVTLDPIVLALLCLIVVVGCLALCALLALEVRDHRRTRHLYASCARDCTEVVVVLSGEEANDAWQRHKKQRVEKEAHGA